MCDAGASHTTATMSKLHYYDGHKKPAVLLCKQNGNNVFKGSWDRENFHCRVKKCF